MADMVSSAVVQETVGQVLSGMVRKYEENEESNAKRNLERLEMAYIRLQAAIETSNKWQITDAPLLRWQRKLKRAAQECDIMLQKCKQRILEDEQKEQGQDSPHLQVALVYMPHGSLEDVLPVDTSSAVAEIHGKDKHWLHTDITFEELNETMLPKAKNYFHHNIEAAIYQKIWRPKHGAAFIQIKKAITEKPSARRTLQGSRKTELVQVQDEDLGFLVHIVVQFLSSWVAHAPTALRGLILNWVQKEMESQLQNQRCT
ncbi:hypothetical protein PR202_gb12098 [Eleusine coracana subsp. coracana]|uniref:Rx N-terminal domain-containing protein n=1 Tax=Eleusine coracana subsp. coracana TaxID=191504 RepID=A0AAV5EQJ0_ELECO|nr:hypothetical protein PR202_gb12098 [Eleusine coracana subsp. coracana]